MDKIKPDELLRLVEMYKNRLRVANDSNDSLEKRIEKMEENKKHHINMIKASNERVKRWKNRYNKLKCELNKVD